MLFDRTTGQPYTPATGDVALLQGTSLDVAVPIEIVTGSRWTHAGWVYVDPTEHPWVIEAISGGVASSEFKDFVGDYNVMVRRPITPFTDAQIAAMTRIALAMVGTTGYSTRSRHLVSGLWWAIAGPPDESADLPAGMVPDAVDCSEEVAILERDGGFDPVPGVAARAVTPAELATSPMLTTIVSQLAVEP